MKAVSYTEPLSRAWEHMKQLLFSPFDMANWFALGFTAWLAALGEGGGGGGNFNIGQDLSNLGKSGHGGGGEFRAFLHHYLWIIILVVLFLVLIGVALGLVFLWLNSRGRFLFLDNIVHRRTKVRRPWREFRGQGNSLFGWRVVFGLVCFVLTILLVGLIALSVLLLVQHRASRVLGIVAIIVLGLLLVAFAIVAGYVRLLLDSFVVPIMHRYRVGAVEGWRRFLTVFRGNAGAFVVFGLFYFVLSLGAGAAVLALIVCTCCCAFFILVIPYLGTVLLLPIPVLFRSYGVTFLHQFLPEVDVDPRPEPPEPPPLAGPEPPAPGAPDSLPPDAPAPAAPVAPEVLPPEA